MNLKGQNTMKKDELIKLGIDEAVAAKIEAATEKELDEKAKDAVKDHVPYTRFKESIDEKNSLKDIIAERDKQLEALKNSSGDMDALKKQITDLQASNAEKDKTHAAEIKTIKANSAIDAALTGAKAKNVKAVRALLDLDIDKADFNDDGTIKGLSDQIKKLTESDDSKFLFDTETKPAKPQIKGASPAASGKEEPDMKVDVSKMSYEEIAAYMTENPDAKI